jgi:hypothetical protein
MTHSVPYGLRLVFVLAAAQVGGGWAEAQAQPLRYTWTANQKFSYRFEITVDEDDETTAFKGITNYAVEAASPEQLRVTYRGGLAESKTVKRTNPGPGGFGPPFGGPFGGRFGGPPGIPSPFSRPVFAGKTQTTNRITLTPRGKTLAMEGDSQLPYLLGNVSLIPFEWLPEGAEREWTLDAGVSITEEDENRRHRFGPFDPFGGQGNKTVQAASEITRYSIQSTSGGLVKVSRSYNLSMPQSGDRPAFKMTGTGTWTFDQKERVPHALEMSYQLTVKDGNTSTTVPIAVKYTRISAEEIARMEAAAKQEAETRAKAAAEAKAKAEAPLTSAQKRDALGVLASGDSGRITKTLSELAAKAPQDPDPEVAAAIEKLLVSKDKAVADGANAALLKWSPAYQRRKSLAKAYEGPGPIDSTGLVVESITPLYVGQLVQAQREHRGTFWFAAQVQELLPDGKVKLGFLTWGKVQDSEVVTRRNIQLAPPELEQPVKPSGAAAAMATPAPVAMRTWSDVSGRFQIEAAFVSVVDGKVNLRRADGRVLAVPLEKLSAADQAYVQQQQQAENPFAVD